MQNFSSCLFANNLPYKELTILMDKRHHYLNQACNYLRIAFSAGVIASIYAGREKMRSAYFINGAASLPS